MKTVKSYKQLGLVFIQGDYISTHEGKKQEPLNRYGVGYCNDSRSNDEKFVIEFAWRNNDGVKPEYKGVIEVVTEGGAIVKDAVDNLQWHASFSLFSRVVKWRPVVLQSEPDDAQDKLSGEIFSAMVSGGFTPKKFCDALIEAYKPKFTIKEEKPSRTPTVSPKEDKQMKPVYTAEMHAKGELPPVGAKCIYVFNDDEEYLGEIAAMDGDACWFKRSGFGYKTFIGKHKFKPIIKTINVNGFDVPAPMSKAPKFDYRYFAVDLLRDDLFSRYTWKNGGVDHTWLAKGLIHSTKSSAIAHAKAMLGIDPNKDAK